MIELPLPFEDATFDYIFIRSMMDTLPDSMWDDVLKELVRIMKKGAYIECVEAYDNLFDAGPSMNTLNQCKYTKPYYITTQKLTTINSNPIKYKTPSSITHDSNFCIYHLNKYI